MPARLSRRLPIARLAVAATLGLPGLLGLLGLLALGIPPELHRHVVAEVELTHHHEHLGEHHHAEFHRHAAGEDGGGHRAPAESDRDEPELPTEGAESDCSFVSAGSVGGAKNASCDPDDVRVAVGSALAPSEVVRSFDPHLAAPARGPPA